MIIQIPLRSGIKEEPFGFYAKEDSNGRPPGVVQMLVGTPGAVNSEWRRNPDRFGHLKVSFDMPITEAQRHAIYDTMAKWNDHKYQLTNSNCIDFVDAVARTVGLPHIDHAPTLTPEMYVRALKHAYEERVAADAQRDAQRILEQQRIEEKEVEEQEAAIRAAAQRRTDNPQLPACLAGQWEVKSPVYGSQHPSEFWKVTPQIDALAIYQFSSNVHEHFTLQKSGDSYAGASPRGIRYVVKPVNCSRMEISDFNLILVR